MNHNDIAPEHLLLGLVREGEGVASRVLASVGVELSRTPMEVEAIIGRGDSMTSPSEITLTPRTKKLIKLAIDESRMLAHGAIGTEHLLLAIVRDSGSNAAEVMRRLGVQVESMRQRVIDALGGATP
jgi:ATP-dependent Clp protease ATP-binding subunit ClpC